jgi:hypothetical protein
MTEKMRLALVHGGIHARHGSATVASGEGNAEGRVDEACGIGGYMALVSFEGSD